MRRSLRSHRICTIERIPTGTLVLALGALSSAFVAGLTSTRFGADGRGTFALAAVVAITVAEVFEGGIGTLMVRGWGSDRRLGPRLTRLVLLGVWGAPLASFITAGVVVAVGFGASGWVALAAGLQAWGRNAAFLAAAAQRARTGDWHALVPLVAPAVMLAIGVAGAIAWGLTAESALLVGSGASAIAGAAFLMVARRWLRDHRHLESVDPEVASFEVGNAFSAYAGGVLTMVALRSDALVVAWYFPLAGLGVYSIATALAEIAWLYSAARSSDVIAISANDGMDRGRLSKTLNQVVALTAILGVLIVILSIALGHLLGREFSQLASVSAALIPGTIALAGWRIIVAESIGSGHGKEKFWSAGVGVLMAAPLLLSAALSESLVLVGLASSAIYSVMLLASFLVRRRRAIPVFTGSLFSN